MATDPLDDPLREVNWRRKLTPTEEAQLRSLLASHPEAMADWEAELALSDALEHLPNPTVASNFTARVVQAAVGEAARAERGPGRFSVRQLWLRWIPATAGAALVIGVSLISYHEIREARQMEMVRSVATFSEVASLPNPQVLEDFDAIRAMSVRPTCDEELLKALQ